MRAAGDLAWDTPASRAFTTASALAYSGFVGTLPGIVALGLDDESAPFRVVLPHAARTAMATPAANTLITRFMNSLLQGA